MLNPFLHRKCCKTSFIRCFIVTTKNLTGGFFIFPFMVTRRGIIFICSSDMLMGIGLIELIEPSDKLTYNPIFKQSILQTVLNVI